MLPNLTQETRYPEPRLRIVFVESLRQVQLHIYDVSQDEKIANLNRWLAPQGSPLKFGGVFHAGVEVTSLEAACFHISSLS